MTGDHENVSDARVDRLVRQLRESASSSEAVAAVLTTSSETFDLHRLLNSPIRELDQKISLNRGSGKIFILALLAVNPQRICNASQQTLWEIEDEDDTPTESPLDPAKIYWSLPDTDEGNLGADTVIKIPEMKRKDILLGDEVTLKSFLLSREGIEQLKNGSVENFRTDRRKLLEAWFAEFVADRVGDRVDLRPAIDAIVKARS